MAVVEFGEFKGSAMIKISRSKEDRFPFQFGVGKARLVVEAYDEIKEFVEREEKKAKKAKTDEEPKKKKKSKDEDED